MSISFDRIPTLDCDFDACVGAVTVVSHRSSAWRRAARSIERVDRPRRSAPVVDSDRLVLLHARRRGMR